MATKDYTPYQHKPRAMIGSKNPQYKHGMDGTKTYRAWVAMKTRCLNKNYPAYPDYGGRGITICDRWLNSFKAFLEDMGESPDGASLDRINNNGNYEPCNCRWATHIEQGQNRRSVKLCTGKVESIKFMVVWYCQTYKSVGECFGISDSQVERIVNGKRWANV